MLCWRRCRRGPGGKRARAIATSGISTTVETRPQAAARFGMPAAAVPRRGATAHLQKPAAR
eukprot:11162411-Lingulodinium_polyedra.AAC.1